MKMLIRSGDKDYLNALKDRLEVNGIPAVIHGTETARMIIPTLVFEPSLWVYINDQFDDARELIKNPDHVVTSGIDVETFYASQPDDEQQNRQFNRLLTGIAVYMVAGMVVIWFVIQLMQKL